MLRLEGTRWIFEDRGSSNGSFLDVQRIGRLSVDRPLILFAQFALSASAFPVRGTAGLDQISYLSSARWGCSAAAASVNVDKLLQDGCDGRRSPSGAVMASQCDPAQAPTKRAWTGDVAQLGGLTALELAGAGIAIRPIGRPRRT